MNKSPLKTSGTIAICVVRESCTFSGHPYIGRIARLSLRQHGFLVRDIAVFVRQCAIFSHSNSSLPKISPCSPGIRWTTFGSKERQCWANCPCNQVSRFPTYVITIHQRYRQTQPIRTDTMQSKYCAMHNSASR